MIININIPELGESITEATIAKWMKKVGESIKKDEIIAEVETEKVTQEIYSSSSGKIIEILYPEGSDVDIGAIIAKVDTDADTNNIINTKKEVKNSNEYITSNKKEEFHLIEIPSSGESISEVTIGKWYKKIGEPVKSDEIILEIETDKATQEVYAGEDGLLVEIYFNEGEDVKIGNKLGKISKVSVPNKEKEKNTPNKEKEKNIPNKEKEKNNEVLALAFNPSSIRRSGFGNKITPNDIKEVILGTPLSPAVRNLIERKNIKVENIESTGPRGRITKQDVLDSYVKSDTLPGLKRIQPANKEVLLEERQNMSRLRQSIALRLKEAQNNAAMLTTFNEVDMTSVKKLRSKYKDKFQEKHNIKLGFMSFFIKASVAALKEMPSINAQIEGKQIVYSKRYDIGVAVGTPQGLLVPVLRNADSKSFAELEKDIIRLGNLAKENKLDLESMRNGTFTISNGGIYGSMLSTPILNYPQSGILGLHNIIDRAVVINGEIKVRPIMYLALTYDHRIIDGREAVTFLVRIKNIIENPENLLLGL